MNDYKVRLQTLRQQLFELRFNYQDSEIIDPIFDAILEIIENVFGGPESSITYRKMIVCKQRTILKVAEDNTTSIGILSALELIDEILSSECI